MPSSFIYDNKPNLNNRQFEQTTGDTLNLSGTTIIYGNIRIPYQAGLDKTLRSDEIGNAFWSVSTSESIIKRIYLPFHGFSVGNVVGFSGNTYNLAIADGTYDGEILGVVSCVVNSNVFFVTNVGFIDGLSGLVPNTTYFLSNTTAGALSATPPTTNGHIRKPMLISISSTSGWVLPYAGYVINNVSGLTPPISETGNDGSFSNNTIFYSCTCGKLVYKDLLGNIHNLY